MSAELVAVDIGGTHARFALAKIGGDGAITLGEPAVLATGDHACFQTAWAAFADHTATRLPRAAAIAVAGPVSDPSDPARVIRFTNNHWTLHPAELPGEIGVERLTIVNDFAAVAHAVAHLAALARTEHFVHLAGPDLPLPTNATISVVGPGTGLGVAWLWRQGKVIHVQATEGGHMDFAPLDSIEDAILARLRARYSRVSVERVVSGPGLVEIYEALAALEARAISPLDDKALWQLGLAGEDGLAAAAVDRFCRMLGAVAGDIALAQGAGAVVIAGGLGLRIKDALQASGFAARFIAKGRFEALMASLPVRLITHPQPGLLGAAAAFAAEYLEEHAA